ncbi:hypothetical protein EY917_07985 [Citrobacter braakii]|nr:hypothetical protein EY917_07985 [Citrobacter braakii]
MAIFPPGAGIVKGTAIVPLTRSQGGSFQRSEKHKVNVATHRRQQIHHQRNNLFQKIILNTPVTTNNPIRKITKIIHSKIFISVPFLVSSG